MKASAVAVYGNCPHRECKNTWFLWKLGTGFCGGGREQSCPLTRVSVKRAFTVSAIDVLVTRFQHHVYSKVLILN